MRWTRLTRDATDDDDDGDRAIYFAEPISSGYVLIPPVHLASVTGLEHEGWKRAHPEFWRQMGIG